MDNKKQRPLLKFSIISLATPLNDNDNAVKIPRVLCTPSLSSFTFSSSLSRFCTNKAITCPSSWREITTDKKVNFKSFFPLDNGICCIQISQRQGGQECILLRLSWYDQKPTSASMRAVAPSSLSFKVSTSVISCNRSITAIEISVGKMPYKVHNKIFVV